MMKKILVRGSVYPLIMFLSINLLLAADNSTEERKIKFNAGANDIENETAVLVLSKMIEGEIFIRGEKDDLVVELAKPFGRRIELSLKEGGYRIVNVVEGEVFKTDIILQKGESFELNPEEFIDKDKKPIIPPKDRVIRREKETILRGKSNVTFFAELGSKITSLHQETALLMGGHFGATFNRTFSVGVAGYGKANFDPGLPGYGGITFGYIFMPYRMVHIRATALAGSGTARCGGIFYIFEPGVEMVLNLSRIVRIQVGFSLPIVDKEFCGLDNPMFNVSFQFGK